MAKQAMINGNVKDQLAGIIAGTSPDYFKNARSLNKAIGLDVKFNKWLKQDGKMGIAFFDDDKKRAKLIEACEQFTSVEEKQAIVIAMLSADIEAIVSAKSAEVTKGIVLSDEQKELHVQALVKFSQTVKRNANRALIELGLALGVVEFEEAPATVAEAVVVE